jgi:hypothetical protein
MTVREYLLTFLKTLSDTACSRKDETLIMLRSTFTQQHCVEALFIICKEAGKDRQGERGRKEKNCKSNWYLHTHCIAALSLLAD